MNYKVNLDSLERIYTSVSEQSDDWLEELEKTKGKVEALMSTNRMFGAAADSIKQYMEVVHLTLIQTLAQAVYLHSSNCLLYKVDYQKNIDTGLHFKIRSSELRDYKERISNTQKKAIEIDGSIDYVLKGIKDIFVISCSDISTVDYQHTQLTNYLNDLDEKIIALENNHYNADFVNTSDLIRTIKSFITELLNADRSYRTNFTIQDLASSDAFKELYGVTVEVGKELESKASSIESATKFQAEYVLALEEEEKESREWIQWVALGVAAIGSVALIVVTAGGATPLVCAAVGAGSGILTAAATNFADNYVETGSFTEGMDWSEFGKDCLVGGVTGAISGCLGANAVGSAIKQPVDKALFAVAGSVVENGAESILETTWDVGEAIIQGKPGSEILSILEENTENMMKDIVVDSAGEFVTNYIGGNFDVSTADKGFWRKTGENFAKSVSEGLAKNTTETVWDIGDAVLDPNSSESFSTILQREGKEFVHDFAENVVESTVDAFIESGIDSYKDSHKSDSSNFKKVAGEFITSTTTGVAGGFAKGTATQGAEMLLGDREAFDFEEIWEEDMEGGRKAVGSAINDAAKEGADLHYEDEKTQIKLGRKDYDGDGKVEVVVFDKYAVLKEDYDAAREAAGKGAYKDMTAQDILGLPKNTPISEKRVVQKTVSIDKLQESEYKGRKKTNVTRYDIKK